MSVTTVGRRAADATRNVQRAIGEEVRRQREDAGISRRELARVAGVSHAFLGEIEAGLARPSISTLNRIAAALGADLSIRLYPNTGPMIRDRHQARIAEAFLRLVHSRWRSNLEVAVYRPVRGVIDAVLDDSRSRTIVCAEFQSDMRRVEQQIRWSLAKAEALPSARLWPVLVEGRDGLPDVSRLLVLRSTRSTRLLVRELRQTFRAAYPADHAAIREALTTADAPWPGPGILWTAVDGEHAEILTRRPPGIG